MVIIPNTFLTLLWLSNALYLHTTTLRSIQVVLLVPDYRTINTNMEITIQNMLEETHPINANHRRGKNFLYEIAKEESTDQHTCAQFIWEKEEKKKSLGKAIQLSITKVFLFLFTAVDFFGSVVLAFCFSLSFSLLRQHPFFLSSSNKFF